MASSRSSFTLSTRRASHGSRRVIVLAVTLGLLAVGVKCIALAQGRMSPLDQTAVRISAPLTQSAIQGTHGLASLGQVFRLGRILNENEQLKQEKAYLESEIAELKYLEQENSGLRKQLGLKPMGGCKPVQASVIARPFDPWLETVILDLGKEAGIEPGCLVANAEGLVGKVSDCGTGYSRVELVASPRFRVAGITHPGGVEGVVRGVSANELAFDFVEARSKVAVGDKVYSKQRDKVQPGEAFAGSPPTPGNLLIGEVVEMTTDQGFLRLRVAPAARTNSLQALTVYVP
jgi:rod shape-determining protein MreC